MTRTLAALALLALAGCAGDDVASPSLAPRPVEKLGFEEPEAPPPAPVASDLALDRRIAELGTALDKAGADFSRAAVEAERLAARARGQAAGSEPWIAAQAALASLDALKADTSERATDVEQLTIARAAELKPDYPALTALQQRAQQELEREAEVIRRIGSSLAPA